jgi:hypothetical protein
MNSIANSVDTRLAAKFRNQVLAAEAEYHRACGLFGHESAEALAAWHYWHGMKRLGTTHISRRLVH